MTATLQHPRYHFDQWLAGGGMGEVWRATDTLLDREVAVKVLRPQLAEDQLLRARFAAEARHAGGANGGGKSGGNGGGKGGGKGGKR